MALTLYHVNWCHECAIVREKLDALGIPYEGVVVPDLRPFRKQVFEVSGQYYVPVLKDGSFSLRVSMPAGTQTITVDVTSPDGHTTKTVTPIVTLAWSGSLGPERASGAPAPDAQRRPAGGGGG